MAKLTVGGSDGAAGGGLSAMLASCVVLFCMISALLGIKIWWFKRRLSFNQGRANNGAAGSATPILRTRSSREKRVSKEIHEPVEIHGTFRRRQENDLDIVPTKQLPPVRNRNLSQSTPSLFPLPPTRRADRVRTAIYEEYEPPAREPPRPPIESPQLTTPTISLVEEMPTFDELEQKYRQMEIKEEVIEQKCESNESLVCMRDKPTQPPKGLYRHSYNEEKVKVGMYKFLKVKLPSSELTQSLQNVNDTCASCYLRTEEKNPNAGLADKETQLNELHKARSHSVEEFGERRPTGYIKYEEIDVLEDFRHKWEQLQTGFAAQSPETFESTERIHYETLYNPNYDHIENIGNEYNQKSWQANECYAKNQGTPVSQASIDFTSDEEFAHELGGFQSKATRQLLTEVKSSQNEVLGHLSQQLHNVTPSPPLNAAITSYTKLNEDAEEVKTSDTRQKVRPEQLWIELEANIKQDEHEKRLWHEIECDLDLNRDFASNIEEEFNKIRHSYEENEAGILENNCSLKRIPKQILISSPEPEGFGKNIDEDWASFENLPINQQQHQYSQLEEVEKPVVQFNLSDLDDAYDSEHTLRDERPLIEYVQNSRKFIRELSKIEDEEEPESPICKASDITFEEVGSDKDNMLVKQCTKADNKTKDVTNMNEDYVHEHNKDSIFEPIEEPRIVQTQARARPRPSQRVSFYFTSTEYIHRAGEECTDGDLLTRIRSDKAMTDEDPTTNPQTFPKPMQRNTNNYYTSTQSSENNSNENAISLLTLSTASPTFVPVLFDTEISLTEGETIMNDSWTEIRQKSEITTLPTSTSPCHTPVKYFSLAESPTPSYRSTAPEKATTLPIVTLNEERIATQNSEDSFRPHADTRKQNFKQSTRNATEA
ncbi:uncharacterized protein [Eurosta solidaginis]|uniref:uncharacterized protein n=1 Tax=Eurosta solidaginis TaxID=178769 RepID=UPI0035308BDA